MVTDSLMPFSLRNIALFPLTLVWAELSDLLLANGVWKKKNRKFRAEKPDLHNQ